MKTVVMPIKKEWFDMICSGKKKEEYRAIGEYWKKRFLANKVDKLKLINGYGKNRPYVIVELKEIIIGTGKEELGAIKDENYYVVKLGKILEWRIENKGQIMMFKNIS